MALPYYSDYRTSYDFRPMKNLNVNQPEFHPITALENDLCELITTGNCKIQNDKTAASHTNISLKKIGWGARNGNFKCIKSCISSGGGKPSFKNEYTEMTG